MKPSDRDPLPDRELHDLLAEWTIPPAPPGLRARIFHEPPRPWWRQLWRHSVRIPLPAACCLGLLLAAALVRVLMPAPPRVVVRTERVEVPVVKERLVTRTVYRERIVRVPERPLVEWRRVARLEPRIIRSEHVEN